MGICYLTQIILVLGFFSICGDVYTFGGGFNLFADIVYLIILAIITNLACVSTYFTWVAWLIVIIHLVGLIGMFYLLFTKSREEIKKILGVKDGFLNKI